MPKAEPMLVLTQWLSPQFPVGAFAYSHGLEAAIRNQWVSSPDDVADWIGSVLRTGTGRCDAILLRAAHGGDTDADAAARALAASAERLQETRLQGQAFCDTLRATEGPDLRDLTYPVAVGQAAAAIDAPQGLTVLLYLQAFVGNLVSAAQRLLPMGQTDGQRVLNRLRPIIAEVAEATEGAGLDDLHSIAWLSDIAAMQHETQPGRLFRT